MMNANNQPAASSSSYLHQYQKSKKNPGQNALAPGGMVVASQHPPTLSMHHSSRKHMNAALQSSMKGLHRYEAHLGIETSSTKPIGASRRFDYNRRMPENFQSHVEQRDSDFDGPTSSQGQPLDSYGAIANKKQLANKKRVQFVEESLESSIYDTHQASEEEEQEEDDEIIDDQMILTHEQQDGPQYQDTPLSVRDKIIDKQMQPKEGFNKKQRQGPAKGSRFATLQGSGQQPSYQKLNKDKRSYQSNQALSIRQSKNKLNYQSASANQGSRKDQMISYNPKMALKDQIQMIDSKLSALNPDDMLSTIQVKPTYLYNSNQGSNPRHYFSNPRQSKGSNTSRYGTSQRRILSLDRASSIGNNNGVTAVRDSSIMRANQQNSKQKLRRKGSGGLPDFHTVNKKNMKKKIFNQVLEKNRLGTSNSNYTLAKPMRNNILSPRTNFIDPRDKKAGKVQITNINVKASAKQNLQDILGTRGRQDAFADLQLEARNSSSNTAEHYEQKYLNAQIDEDIGTREVEAGAKQAATLRHLKEGSNQLDVPIDRTNYRSFENLKKPSIDQHSVNQLAVPQVYEQGENLNNIILSNDFTAYNNYQEIQAQKVNTQQHEQQHDRSRQADKLKQMRSNQQPVARDSKLQKRGTDEMTPTLQGSRDSNATLSNAAANVGLLPVSHQSSGYFQSPQYSKSQQRLSDNAYNKVARVSSRAISDKSESVRGGGSKQQVVKPGEKQANLHDYYLTNESAQKAMKPQVSSRNVTTSQVSAEHSAGYEAGSVYRSEFSANKLRLEKPGASGGNGLGQQNSMKSESGISRNDTSGLVPAERPEYQKYYELVKKRSHPLNLENIGDEDVTLQNDAPQLGKASLRQAHKSPRKQEQGRSLNPKQPTKWEDRLNQRKPQSTLKKSATSAQLSASKRKQIIDNGPFQRTEAMLVDPQQISVVPESEAQSQSQKTQKRRKYDMAGKQKEPPNESKNFLKTNIGDFKQKILGAMQSTNQAVQNAGRKPDGFEAPTSNEKAYQPYESIYRETENKSPKCRSPSANQFIQPQKTSLVLVPESSFPVANSEVQNTYDFYKSGDDIRQLQDEKSNNNSEVQFRASERSQQFPQCPQYQQELTQTFQTPNNAAAGQQEMKIEGAVEINKEDLDDLYRQSEKLDKQIKLRNNQDNLASLNAITQGSDSNMCGPFPNRYDRFQSPHQDYSNKINPYGSKSIQGGGYLNRVSRYQRSTSKYSQQNNQFDKQSRAYTSSKIDELMKNQKIQEILLEPNDQFENLLLSDHNQEGDDAQNNDIESKIETLLTLLNNFMLRHGVTSFNVPGSGNDTDDQQKSQTAEGFSPSEQFLLNAIDKLSNYIEVLQARETAQKHQQIKSGLSNDTQRLDYPGTASTPNSMFAGNKLMNQLSPNAQRDTQKAANSPDQGVYQKLALAEVKMKRLIGQIQEMNIEYKCQKTQVEALEKFNDSLNNQIKRLEQKLHETQSQFHQQSKVGSVVFGVGGADRTPRQMMLEEKLRQRDQSVRSRERLNSLQLQMQTNNNLAKSSLEFTKTNFLNNPLGPTVFSPQSTRTLIQPGNEPFKSVEVTENCSIQGTQQNLQAQQNPPSQFNVNEK